MTAVSPDVLERDYPPIPKLLTLEEAARLLRRIAEVRAKRDVEPHRYAQMLDWVREHVPRVLCADCQGTARGCKVCKGRGLVCPHCRGNRYLYDNRENNDPLDPTPHEIMLCACSYRSQDTQTGRVRVLVDESKEIHMIQDALRASGWTRGST